MEDDLKTDLMIYLVSIRRLWWVVVACVVSLTGFLLISSQSTTSSSQSTTSDAASDSTGPYQETTDLLDTAALPGFKIDFTNVDLASRIGSSDIKRVVEESTGASGILTSTAATDHLVLAIEAETREDTSKLTDAYIKAAQQIKMEAWITVASQQLSATNAQISAIVSSLQDLDEKIRTERNPAVAGLLVLQRRDTETPLAGLQSQAAVLGDIASSTTGAIQVISRSTVDLTPQEVIQIESSTTWSARTRALIFGITGGLLIGLLLMIILMLLDKKIRRSSDIDAQLGRGSVIGVLPVTLTPAVINPVAAAIQNSSNTHNRSTICLITLSANPLFGEICRQLSAELPPHLELTISRPFADFEPVDFDMHLKTLNILLAEYGTSDKTELRRVKKLMDRSGCELSSAILASVPDGIAHLL